MCRAKKSPSLSSLSADHREKLEALRRALEPLGGALYVVGGAVRDLAMDRVPLELDVEVYGLQEQLFADIMLSLGADGVGKSFFVYKWRGIDVGLPRKELKTSYGHRGFSVEIETDMKKACSRRDFTMNAMMIGVHDDRLYDFFGGMSDVCNSLIRMIDERTFAQDSLRALRAVQFASRFGFRIESRTLDICRSLSLDDLPKERIWQEFRKLISGEFIHFGLFYLLKTDAMRKLFDVKIDSFFKTAREMLAAYAFFGKAKDEALFFYVLRRADNICALRLLETLGAPMRLRRFCGSQPKAPKDATNRFLAAVALRYPLREWLGAYRPKVCGRAKELGFWSEKAILPFTPALLMDEGYTQAALGRELKRRRTEWLRENFKGKA